MLTLHPKKLIWHSMWPMRTKLHVSWAKATAVCLSYKGLFTRFASKPLFRPLIYVSKKNPTLQKWNTNRTSRFARTLQISSNLMMWNPNLQTIWGKVLVVQIANSTWGLNPFYLAVVWENDENCTEKSSLLFKNMASIWLS